MATLQVGSHFPGLTAQADGGQDVRIADVVKGHPAVVIFYRGHW